MDYSDEKLQGELIPNLRISKSDKTGEFTKLRCRARGMQNNYVCVNIALTDLTLQINLNGIDLIFQMILC